MCCCSSLQYILYSALMPHVRLCLLLMFSFCLGVSFHLFAAEPFWERVREVQQARQQQSTQNPLFGREDLQSLANDWYCAHPGVPLIIFTKSPSNQSGQVKTLTHRACLLCTWLQFFFFPLLTFQLSAPVSVATSGTSSRDEEVFSTALQSNGNDCAPGETEDCICVLEWSAVMRLRGKHAWKQNGRSPEYRFIPMVPCGESFLKKIDKQGAGNFW